MGSLKFFKLIMGRMICFGCLDLKYGVFRFEDKNLRCGMGLRSVNFIIEFMIFEMELVEI